MGEKMQTGDTSLVSNPGRKKREAKVTAPLRTRHLRKCPPWARTK